MLLTLNRRHFLTLSSIAGLGFLTPVGLLGSEQAPSTRASRRRTLVVIHLDGGNDACNTLVSRDGAIARERPGLALDPGSLVPVDGAHGLHPALSAWGGLAAGREMAFHLGASESVASHGAAWSAWHRPEGSGWLAGLRGSDGRALVLADHGVEGATAGPASGLVSSLSSGAAPVAVVPLAVRPHGDRFEIATAEPARFDQEQALARELHYLASGYDRLPGFPTSAFGASLERATRLLVNGHVPDAILVRQPGYDTHQDQLPAHAACLTELAAATTALRQALIAAGRWDSTEVLIVSEFGRSLADNAEGGTDHGPTQLAIRMGGKLHQPGVHGRYDQPFDARTLQRDICARCFAPATEHAAQV